MAKADRKNIYNQIIEKVFHASYRRGAERVEFARDEIVKIGRQLGEDEAKNVGDIIYTYGFRRRLPESIVRHAPEGKAWIIRLAGSGKYCFCAVPVDLIDVRPREGTVPTKIPDATPGLIARYSLTDEQALLAILRYNRLIDTFLGITCYSLQNHLRTQVQELGQVETDEIYVGVDKRGAQYVVPIQAKGGRDKLGIVQVEQDVALCARKFPDLLCKPVGAQFMRDDVIALFGFEISGSEIGIVNEKHYKLAPKDEVTPDDIRAYNARVPD